jgi:hypothetical protein
MLQFLPARPHRLAAQDVALSRPKQGFDSPWGHFLFRSAYSYITQLLPEKLIPENYHLSTYISQKKQKAIINFMEIGNTLYVSERSDWRAWLAENFQIEPGICLALPNKSTGKSILIYNDSVE